MKTLHSYLTRQVLGSLLMSVAVFTSVLLLGNVLREILNLLVNRQASPGVVIAAIGLLIPFVWVFALPMGMLTATLLVFGRFSADQELTAVRASGLSLVSLVSPILLLSLALCGVSALVNMNIAPRCRVAYTRLLSRLEVEMASGQLPEGRFISSFPGWIFYVGGNRGGELRDVIVFQLKDQTNVVLSAHAPRGKLEVDSTARRVTVHLHNAKVVEQNGAVFGGNFTIELNLNPVAKEAPKVSDMTFSELWEQWRKLERLRPMAISLKGLTREQGRLREQEWEKSREDMISHLRFEIHRQIAFSFACFGFTLVGIPLGIRVHRRETNVGIAVALLLVAVYYGFILVGQTLEDRPELAPHLILWLPNFVFQAAGSVLLWKANRGF